MFPPLATFAWLLHVVAFDPVENAHFNHVIPDAEAPTAQGNSAAPDPGDPTSNSDALGPDEPTETTGTLELLDSDRDGVPDVLEDRNLDGQVDPGESDPQRPGLFPGTGPHIPEPLHFDLVRGLGARAGELEVNLLGVLPFGATGLGNYEFAPEIEYAPRDGFAVEFELGIHSGELALIKLAAQMTIPRPPSRRFIDGVQIIAEVDGLHDRPLDFSTTALYIAGLRFARRWSLLGMAGARIPWNHPPSPTTLILNPSLFVDLREWLTAGLENNLSVATDGAVALYILPQIHLQISRHWRVQASLGAEYQRDHGLGGVGVFRLIIER